MSEEITFTCSACGKDFPADPDTMVEVGFTAQRVASIEEIPGDADFVERRELEAMGEYQLSELGLTSNLRDALLRGEDVTTGAECICLKCQDQMLEESEQ